MPEVHGGCFDSFNPEVTSFLRQSRTVIYQQTGDWAGSQQLALQMLADLRQQQSVTFAFFDVFWVAAFASLALVFLVFLMKPSGAETNPIKK